MCLFGIVIYFRQMSMLDAYKEKHAPLPTLDSARTEKTNTEAPNETPAAAADEEAK